jgi:hypothetical protein
MRTTIQITGKKLAKTAERSPGYSVQIIERGTVYTLTEIRFPRHARSGRRNCAVIDCLSDGRFARFHSDDVFDVLD